MRKILLQTILVNFLFVLCLMLAASIWVATVIPFKEIALLKAGTHHQKNWVSINRINKNVATAIVVSEDWSFYRHNGIDVAQVVEALHDHYYEGKKLRGASTISQQVSKNLFLTNERSYYRKFKEALITLYLEKELNKRQILEIYLNVAQFGKNLYGIRNAAHYYFRKTPSQLTPREAAFLAMLLPNPEKYSSSFYRKELTRFALTSIETILLKMKASGVISSEDVEMAKSESFRWEAPPSLVL